MVTAHRGAAWGLEGHIGTAGMGSKSKGPPPKLFSVGMVSSDPCQRRPPCEDSRSPRETAQGSQQDAELWDLGTTWMWGKVREDMRRYPTPDHRGTLTDTEDCMQGERSHWHFGGIRNARKDNWAFGCWCPL